MSDYKEKYRKDIRFVAKFVFWLMASVVVILMFVSLLSAADFVDTDGWIEISWEKPSTGDQNLKGYRLEVYGLNVNYIKICEGTEPPTGIKYQYYENNHFAIVRVYSIDLTGKLCNFAEVSVQLIAPEAPKNLEVK